MNKVTSVGIVGATGYTGSELIRILTMHPGVSLSILTSETHHGKKISDIYPYLSGICDKKLMKKDELKEHELDLVFLALPHGVSMEFVKNQWEDGYKIVDLSGDFRLSSADVYQKWYKIEHQCPNHLNDAVYGMPELFRENIKKAKLVSNPGCYPTSAILGLAPLLQKNIIQQHGIIIDSKSGVTGAGAKVKKATHFPTANENFNAYGIANHRHTPEIEEILGKITGQDIQLNFTPHLLPINRGILTTAYTEMLDWKNENDVRSIYYNFYKKEPFIRLRDEPVSVQAVRGSNFCDVNPILDMRTNKIIITSAIDNLIKGAAGQAVQNMNIMLGFQETLGIDFSPLSP
jgi:N-acetyl-gamma-glutamyl-phosphate reductase